MDQLIKLKVNISRQHFAFVVLIKMCFQYASHCIGISHGWVISSIAIFEIIRPEEKDNKTQIYKYKYLLILAQSSVTHQGMKLSVTKYQHQSREPQYNN